jgi:hypothetical protein
VSLHWWILVVEGHRLHLRERDIIRPHVVDMIGNALHSDANSRHLVGEQRISQECDLALLLETTVLHTMARPPGEPVQSLLHVPTIPGRPQAKNQEILLDGPHRRSIQADLLSTRPGPALHPSPAVVAVPHILLYVPQWPAHHATIATALHLAEDTLLDVLPDAHHPVALPAIAPRLGEATRLHQLVGQLLSGMATV